MAHCHSVCRLSEAADLLRSLVLPRLRLRDAHALRQTCRALRQAVNAASNELQPLALVPQCLSAMQLLLSAAAELCAVQKLMPAEHLVSLAAEGATSIEQLDALAGLHTRIAQGQVAVASEVHVQQADLRLKHTELDYYSSELSPSGSSVIIFWKAVGRLERSVTVLGVQDGAVTWRRHQQHGVQSMTWSAGYSPCGKHVATMSQPSANRQVAGDSLLAARLFNVEQLRWCPRQPVLLRDVDAYGGETGHVTFSDAGAPQLAASLVHDHTLLVLSESQAIGIPAAGAWSVQWLPGQHAVVLLEQRGLARLQLHPLSAAPLAPSWVPYAWLQPDCFEEYCFLCMGAAPEGGVFWVAQMAYEARVRIMAYSALDLTCLGGWLRSAPSASGGQGRAPQSVRVSRQAIAVHLGECTDVFSRTGRFALGRRVCRVDDFIDAVFSADGRWLAGRGQRYGAGRNDTVRVVDARSGVTVARVQPGDSYRTSFEVSLDTVHWNCGNPCQAFVKTRLKGPKAGVQGRDIKSVLFSTLQFGP